MAREPTVQKHAVSRDCPVGVGVSEARTARDGVRDRVRVRVRDRDSVSIGLGLARKLLYEYRGKVRVCEE